ncbi:putative bifunctional diguanylate cyclase/phosphodiesterase [Arthrobacter bambusae]|uniref:putative bifunctional diguanylate cyclase/phosphodiesterase n=1 Tax=Arthrobacter bambusae TaxID=1338426 RepID=UPI00278A5C6C|nr:EAL domain-containing protein [Arthrobacter bambusae]MDQ0029401.1 diguanylate cyclase (GGDEF)-like protein [Arthrobacter bambusae]MDQ0097061.1 diguanylate cyclase (GGDEF)-like protein [Arthrobacter bambusae]
MSSKGGSPVPSLLSPLPSSIGDLGVAALVVPNTVSATDIDAMFRNDRSLRAVVIEQGESFGLLTRDHLEFQLAGRLGYGRALNTRRSASELLPPAGTTMPADLDLQSAAQAVLERPECERYQDVLVLGPTGPRVVTVSDIFAAVSAHFRHASLHDPLTGLPNRRMLEEHCPDISAGAGLPDVGILFIDLDDFKSVNDTYGHRVGDAVLTEFARRLARSVGHRGSLVRLGGDEFAVLLTDVDEDAACAVATGILDSLEAPFAPDGCELRISATIGLALGVDIIAEDMLAGPEVLLRHADGAMLRAKQEGKGRIGRIGPCQEPATFARQAHIRRRLSSAVDHSALTLHYQPVLDLATGEEAGVEALLRWNDREIGPVAPDEFIPLAEQTGEIRRIGAWVLEQACAQSRSWIDAGTPRHIAVNVSPVQFASGTLPSDIRTASNRHGIPAGMLEIEITEGMAIVDVPAVASQLRELIDMGVGVALDDYGSAYSSVAMLRVLPLTTLKIDKAFVRDIDSEPYTATIVRGLIQTVNAMGARVTAEGVERQEQLNILRELGCDTAQGYLIAPPMAPSEFRMVTNKTKGNS